MALEVSHAYQLFDELLLRRNDDVEQALPGHPVEYAKCPARSDAELADAPTAITNVTATSCIPS